MSSIQMKDWTFYLRTTGLHLICCKIIIKSDVIKTFDVYENAIE